MGNFLNWTPKIVKNNKKSFTAILQMEGNKREKELKKCSGRREVGVLQD